MESENRPQSERRSRLATVADVVCSTLHRVVTMLLRICMYVVQKIFGVQVWEGLVEDWQSFIRSNHRRREMHINRLLNMDSVWREVMRDPDLIMPESRNRSPSSQSARDETIASVNLWPRGRIIVRRTRMH